MMVEKFFATMLFGYLRAPRKIASGMALASIHSGYRSGPPWPAHSEPVFFEVHLSLNAPGLIDGKAYRW